MAQIKCESSQGKKETCRNRNRREREREQQRQEEKDKDKQTIKHRNSRDSDSFVQDNGKQTFIRSHAFPSYRDERERKLETKQEKKPKITHVDTPQPEKQAANAEQTSVLSSFLFDTNTAQSVESRQFRFCFCFLLFLLACYSYPDLCLNSALSIISGSSPCLSVFFVPSLSSATFQMTCHRFRLFLLTLRSPSFLLLILFLVTHGMH